MFVLLLFAAEREHLALTGRAGADRTRERVQEIGLGDTLNALTSSPSPAKRERGDQSRVLSRLDTSEGALAHMFCPPLRGRHGHDARAPVMGVTLLPAGVMFTRPGNAGGAPFRTTLSCRGTDASWRSIKVWYRRMEQGA